MLKYGMEISEPDQPKSGIVNINGFKMPYQITDKENSADLEIKIPVSKVLDKSVVEDVMTDVLKSKKWYFRENLEGKELIERYEIVLDDNVHVDVFSFNPDFKQEHIEEIAKALSLLYGSLKDKSLWTLKDIILEKENVFNRKTGGNKNGEECISGGYIKIYPVTLREGKNISDILDMTVEEALKFFENISFINNKLKTLDRVGLGYIRLGQAATTLSGGEAQRVKLATELAKKQTGKTMYILDEPTTGLHFYDVEQLLHVLHSLVQKGNTVLVIEHNLDVIKTADHIIDLGPEGGDKGGAVIFEGTVSDIVECKESYTGQWLKKIL